MSVFAANSSQLMCRELMHQREQNPQRINGGLGLFPGKPYGYGLSDHRRMMGTTFGKSRVPQATSFFGDLARGADVVDMEEIKDCEQLDQILLEAKDLSQPVLIDWMANWCRKCIYLKPKLEKLAAEYSNKLKFYCVDVNNVPQSLVKRGNISKMPTIQLWKDGEFKAEVIGGHKAWLVVDEVREMIKKYL